MTEENEVKIYKLNVGGDQFHIGKETFKKLKNIDSKAKLIQEGEYFIDRDGAMFSYILKYLRYNKIIFSNDFKDEEQLLEDAKFYEISGLEKALENGAGSPQSLLMVIMTPDTMPTVDVFLQTTFIGPATQLNSIFKADNTDSIDLQIIRHSHPNALQERTPNGEISDFMKNIDVNNLVFSTNDYCMEMKFLSFLFKKGFTLVGNTITANHTYCGKPYAMVKQMIFQKIKPAI